MRSRLLASALVALALVATGCGDDGKESRQGLETLQLAATKTADGKTARMVMSVVVDGATPINFTGTGVANFAQGASSMTMNLGAQGNAELIFLDEVLYVRAAGLSLPKGKTWGRLDLNTLGQQSGLTAGALQQLRNQDPTKALDYLRGVSGTVTRVAREDVRDAPTTHYRAMLDLQKAADALGGGDAALQAALKSAGGKPFPVDVWVDDAGRMRKMTQSIPVGDADDGNLVLSIEMYDFGTPVSIKAPPSDQTAVPATS